MSKVTEAQARKVVALIKEAFPAYVQEFADDTYTTLVPTTDPDMLPRLMEDWDGYDYAIVWESGSPYGWVHLFPYGGVDEEFGFRSKDVSAKMPKGVYAEAVNSCVIGLGR